MSDIISKARNVRKVIEAAIAVTDDKTASQAVMLSAKLKGDGSLIVAGTRIGFDGVLKRATVDLWDTEENNPDNSPALWEDIMYKDGIRIIPDVITVTSAFEEGELGWWNDVMYESLISVNVYTPEQYPAGWKIKE